MATIDVTEFRLMRDYIEKYCGIHLDDQKSYLIETRLTTLMAENGCRTFTEFYQKANADFSNTLRDKIIDAMTTNETLWFRDSLPYSVLKEFLLPKFWKEIVEGKRKTIRIWSAACSTGQEPYSISMIVSEFGRQNPSFQPSCVEITATDISPTVLVLAKAARYDSLVMSRGMPEDLKNRYFNTVNQKVWTLDEKIRNTVVFRRLNLQEGFSFLGKLDIVFCRNVLIYFSDAFKKDILARIANQLRPSGFLFVGASESITNYTTEYQMLSHNKALYYQVR